MRLRPVLRALGKERETGWCCTLLVCLPYLLFLARMRAHHEMWHDEIHA